jgi:NADH-quinone oxidoreductase subunit M
MMANLLATIRYGDWILHTLMLLPLLGVALVLVAPERWARWLTAGVAVVELGLSLGLWWAFDPADGGVQFLSRHEWMPQYGISYTIGVDGISLFMVLLSTAMMPLLVVGSWRAIKTKVRGFYALLLALKTGMIGVFVSLDLFLFYACWELLLIPMYFLVGVWGGPRRVAAATKFVVYTFVGSLLMLVSIVAMVQIVAQATGTWSFDYAHLLEHRAVLASAAPWLFVGFALAFAVKVPLFPFHTWLPDAHVEAPTAGSVDLAVILLKMGTYGFLRFAVPLFPAFALSEATAAVFTSLSVAGIVVAALVAMVQTDVKRIVAYSSVSHLGFVMLGIWAGTVEAVQGAIIIMLAHGVSSAALFFLIGMMQERRKTREVNDFGGLARSAPLLATGFLITSFAAIGLPGLSGFTGEFLVLLGTWARYPLATALATTVVIWSACYLLWAVQRIFFNPLKHAEVAAMPDLDRRELAVIVPLVLAMVWLGLYPKPFLDRTESASRRYVELVAPYYPSAAAPVQEAAR